MNIAQMKLYPLQRSLADKSNSRQAICRSIPQAEDAIKKMAIEFMNGIIYALQPFLLNHHNHS